jgi:hypothetical protein
MSFGLAAVLFVLWFGGYMALQYFVIGIQGAGVSAAVVIAYVAFVILYDMKKSGWGLFKK